MQETVVLRRMPARTSARQVCCFVCGRGLEDGHSVTARAVRDGTAMFCGAHLGA